MYIQYVQYCSTHICIRYDTVRRTQYILYVRIRKSRSQLFSVFVCEIREFCVLIFDFRPRYSKLASSTSIIQYTTTVRVQYDVCKKAEGASSQSHE